MNAINSTYYSTTTFQISNNDSNTISTRGTDVVNTEVQQSEQVKAGDIKQTSFKHMAVDEAVNELARLASEGVISASDSLQMQARLSVAAGVGSFALPDGVKTSPDYNISQDEPINIIQFFEDVISYDETLSARSIHTDIEASRRQLGHLLRQENAPINEVA